MYQTKDELVTALRYRVRDPIGATSRWSDAEVLAAINTGIGEMYGRVGYYVEAPMEASGDYWVPPYYMIDQIVPLVDGAAVNIALVTGGAVIEGAVLSGWVYNDALPEASYTLAIDLDADAEEMTVTASGPESPPSVGHVKVGLEIIRYNDVAPTSPTTFTLKNLQRSMNGSGELAASSASPVDFAVYLDHNHLREIILSLAMGYLHSLYITDGSPTEIGQHQWAMRWNTQQVQNFWRRYVPGKQYRKLPARRLY